MKSVKVAVIGAGVVGMSTAVCIAETLPYCSVTVLAEKFSPNTTSDVAAGILLPDLIPDVALERQHRWFKDTFDHLLTIIESPQASEAGVLLSSGYQVFKDVPINKKPYWSDCVFGLRTMTDVEMKRFPNHKFGQAVTTIKCESLTYLPWLEKRFRKAGGELKLEKVTDLQQLAHCYDVIVNCSGLGSRSLVGDEEVYPVRGQIFKVNAPWLKNFVRDTAGNAYIYPGIDYVTLGGTRQMNNWSLEVNKEDSKGIMERCCGLVPALRNARVLEECVGLRPGRKVPRVEREWLQLQKREVLLVHNYGHGAWGISLAWGTALEALDLVRQSLQENPPCPRLFRKAGGELKLEKVTDLQQLAHCYDVIVNCSGLGSRSLVGDEEVYPVRGQIIKVNAPWVKYFVKDIGGNAYVYSGIDHVTLGGTRQMNNWSLEVDKEDSKGIMERCCKLIPALRNAQVLEECVGLRPGRKVPRVEREWLQVQQREVLLVHNYGHGSWGISLAWGTALEALDLVRQSLQENPPCPRL